MEAQNVYPQVGETYSHYYDRVQLAKAAARYHGQPEPDIAQWYWRQPPKAKRSPVLELEALREIAKSQAADPRVTKAAQAKLDAYEAAGKQFAASRSRQSRQPSASPSPDELLKSMGGDLGFQRRAGRRFRKLQTRRQLRELKSQRKAVRALMRG
jgi:hypothetical protein